MIWISLVVATAIPIVVIGGFFNRATTGKGIGWQYIRFTVIAIALPTIALLGLNNLLTGEAAALIGTAMGYAFGKADEK
jgi:hypothetical protein